jgi:hypothetical protein
VLLALPLLLSSRACGALLLESPPSPLLRRHRSRIIEN